MEPQWIAAAFVDAINSRDPFALEMLITANHVTRLSCGTALVGSAALIDNLIHCCEASRSTRFQIERFVVEDDLVVMIGSNCVGTDCIPAVWTITLTSGQVASWCVYAANPQPYGQQVN